MGAAKNRGSNGRNGLPEAPHFQAFRRIPRALICRLHAMLATINATLRWPPEGDFQTGIRKGGRSREKTLNNEPKPTYPVITN
jgi:hypothetical protein